MSETNFVPVKEIRILEGVNRLLIGQTLRLNLFIFPPNATNQIVTWSSSDDSLAHVDNNGTVYVNNENNVGTVTITASTNGLKTHREIRITCIESIAFTIPHVCMLVGNTFKPSINVFPKTAPVKYAELEVENKSILHMASDCTLTALKNGNTKIFATSIDGEAKCHMTINVTSAYLDVTAAQLSVRKPIYLKGKIDSGAITGIAWTSSDAGVCSISVDGQCSAIVTGVRKGKTRINAHMITTHGEIDATCDIVVT